MFCTFHFFFLCSVWLFGCFFFRFRFVEKNGRCGSIHLLGGCCFAESNEVTLKLFLAFMLQHIKFFNIGWLV